MSPIRPRNLHAIRALLLPGALLLLLPGSLPGSAKEAPVLSLTLVQALRIALEQNPKVHQSLLVVAESQEERRAAASSLLPSLGAQAMGQRAKNNLDAFIGIPTPHGPNVVGPFSWGQVGVEARATLFDFSVWNRWKAAEQGESSARAQATTVREELCALVVGQYFRALRAQATIVASKSRVGVAEALATLAENQQKNGVGTRLDTLRSQVQLQNERQRLIQSETQLKVALAGLGRLLNVQPGTGLILMDTLAAPSIPAIEFTRALEEGLKQRPEMAALEAREKAAGLLHDSARSLRLPSLVATAGYGSTGLHSQPWAATYQLTLALRVPLFTGGLIAAQVARADLEASRLREAQRELQAQIGLDVQVAQAELEAARSEVEVAQSVVRLAEEALEQARHRFEAGVTSSVELIASQDDVARAQENQISALYRLNLSRADLAKATGGLEALFSR